MERSSQRLYQARQIYVDGDVFPIPSPLMHSVDYAPTKYPMYVVNNRVIQLCDHCPAPSTAAFAVSEADAEAPL